MKETPENKCDCHCHKSCGDICTNGVDTYHDWNMKNSDGCYCGAKNLHPKQEENKPEYSEIDHGHCWESKNPPCGQKIEHFKCCLCENLNPKIKDVVAETRRELLDEIDHIVKEWEECKPTDEENAGLGFLLDRIKHLKNK